MDMGQSNRPALLDRAMALAAEEAGFARFLKAAILATDSEDLGRQSPQQFEATPGERAVLDLGAGRHPPHVLRHPVDGGGEPGRPRP